MHKVYYKFEDGKQTYSLKEAREYRDATNTQYVVGYEFIPMPVDAAEGGTPRDPIAARKPKGLRTTSLNNIVRY